MHRAEDRLQIYLQRLLSSIILGNDTDSALVDDFPSLVHEVCLDGFSQSSPWLPRSAYGAVFAAIVDIGRIAIAALCACAGWCNVPTTTLALGRHAGLLVTVLLYSHCTSLSVISAVAAHVVAMPRYRLECIQWIQ